MLANVSTAKHLNSYFELMARIVAGGGGDILKFAGDAMIVLWPQKDDIQKQICRAVQCGLEVQSKLNCARLTDEVTLSVKIVSHTRVNLRPYKGRSETHNIYLLPRVLELVL